MNDASYKIIENAKEIEKIQDRFSLMLKNLDGKMDDFHKDRDKGFAHLNNKVDSLEKRIDTIDDSLEKRIDTSDKELPIIIKKSVCENLEQERKNRAYKVANWIVVSVLGGAVIVAFGRVFCDLVLKLFGIQ